MSNADNTDQPEPTSSPDSETTPGAEPTDYFTGAGATDEHDDAGDPGHDPTLKDLVTGKAPASLQLTGAANQAVRAAVRNVNLQRNQAVMNALRPLTRSSALRTAALGNIFPKYDTKRLLQPMLDQLKPTNDLLDARVRAQLAASLPSTRLTKQFDQVRRAFAANTIPRIVPPPSVFKNLYGPEFGGIATKLIKFQRVFEGIDWERITTGWYPPNWDRDRGIEQYATFIALADEEGLPLTWAPNTELTYLLAEAPSETRSALLVEHAPTILGDCETVLADFDDQSFLAESLSEAIAAFRDGHTKPALSMAASVIDTTLREAFPDAPHMGFYPHIKDLLHTGDQWEETELRAARALPTSVAILGMIKNFRPDRDDPVPSQPNRHAAAHAVHPNQYTPVNAIKFLMLATAVLAELEYDGWPRILDIAA